MTRRNINLCVILVRTNRDLWMPPVDQTFVWMSPTPPPTDDIIEIFIKGNARKLYDVWRLVALPQIGMDCPVEIHNYVVSLLTTNDLLARQVFFSYYYPIMVSQSLFFPFSFMPYAGWTKRSRYETIWKISRLICGNIVNGLMTCTIPSSACIPTK